MKKVLVVAMALGLSACGSMDFFGDSGSDTPAAVSAPEASNPVAQTDTSTPASAQATDSTPAPVAQATRSDNAHCKALAKQRAIDAAFQGEDGDTQESVYNRTYADCVDWDVKHNL